MVHARPALDGTARVVKVSLKTGEEAMARVRWNRVHEQVEALVQLGRVLAHEQADRERARNHPEPLPSEAIPTIGLGHGSISDRRALALALLRVTVAGLDDIKARDAGAAIFTPILIARDVLEGFDKAALRVAAVPYRTVEMRGGITGPLVGRIDRPTSLAKAD